MRTEKKGSGMKHLRIWNNRHGFSLTELLVAVLILSMVSAVVAGGIPVAKNAYEKITVSANAQVMLSTTISALRNELGTASNVTIEGSIIRYYNASTGWSEITIGPAGKSNNTGETSESNNTGETILLKRSANSSRPLVPKAVGDEMLYVVYDKEKVSYDNGIITFMDLKVTNGSIDYASLSEVNIRLISPDLFYRYSTKETSASGND